MKLSRYLLFMGNQYYPYGGWSDFYDSFSTFDEVMSFLVTCQLCHESTDWWEIVDTETGEETDEDSGFPWNEFQNPPKTHRQ